VAEQFAFDKLARNRRHVDRDKGPGAALPKIMQRARDQFLPRAAFAGDHDREVGSHQPGDRAIDLLHRW
jgi:hypothetical protein